ncbi:hypothetical protein [Microbacterium sp. VKM Ac-2923]|uniref:hypothetical protein n=1 Tax=Microbacterium sp. VKM Ac-2923 TaxID=2929476 RepID=UPI001FB521C0|nr:hypothetical protein [Microbacterium sp. VKM Ac-2923]MCJ1709202.1 hypothetical protein [Microbacterium sp. VKM Ac-2923]
MSSRDVAFLPATLALRPPRVAILVPDDEHWRTWASHALAVASEYWGGGGFILVTYSRDTAEPADRFAEIVRAYDPDHVVTLEMPASDYEALYPGALTVQGARDEAHRIELVNAISGGITENQAQWARERVVSWCSPLRAFRLGRQASVRQHELVKQLGRPNREDRYRRGLPLAPIEARTKVLAGSTAWGSDAALFAAYRVGVAGSAPDQRPDPGDELLSWLISTTGDVPRSLLWSSTGEQLSDLDRVATLFDASQGLIQVSRGYLRDSAVVIIGDTGTDFALAVAYDRLVGRGIWLSDAMRDGGGFEDLVRPAVWSLVAETEHSGRRVLVTSASRDDAEVNNVVASLSEYGLPGGLRLYGRIREHETLVAGAPELGDAVQALVVAEHVGASVVLPVTQHDDGTRESLTKLESPIPSDLLYSDLGKLPYWYVDVSLGHDTAPRARDLPASALLATEGDLLPEVNLRASRDGLSYDASSMGFVGGGTLLPGRIGRPRLRALSIRAWAEGMAEAQGLGVRLSRPGRQAELVQRRLGSRRALLDLVSGPALPLLRAFIPRDKAPKLRDPEVVVLGLDPYLSFDAMNGLLALTEDEAIQMVDELAVARLLRRGLVLSCQECERPSFIDADRLGQRYECPQCATPNTLSSERWRRGAEPRWFYDLFATFRELLLRHGDVPLLAAARLREGSHSYADASELEFYDRVSGKNVAEIDLVASVDGEVVVAEAKVAGAYKSGERGRQSKKLMKVATVLRADKVVLATSQDHWNETDVRHLIGEAAAASPFAVDVEVMTSLGA